MNTDINLRRVGVAYSSEEGPRTLRGDRKQDGKRMENVPLGRGTDQEKGALCAAHRKDCWARRRCRDVCRKSVACGGASSQTAAYIPDQSSSIDILRRPAKRQCAEQ